MITAPKTMKDRESLPQPVNSSKFFITIIWTKYIPKLAAESLFTNNWQPWCLISLSQGIDLNNRNIDILDINTDIDSYSIKKESSFCIFNVNM